MSTVEVSERINLLVMMVISLTRSTSLGGSGLIMAAIDLTPLLGMGGVGVVEDTVAKDTGSFFTHALLAALAVS